MRTAIESTNNRKNTVIRTHDSENSNLPFLISIENFTTIKLPGPGIAKVVVASAAKTLVFIDRRLEALVRDRAWPARSLDSRIWFITQNG
jgi:hypothetical protein